MCILSKQSNTRFEHIVSVCLHWLYFIYSGATPAVTYFFNTDVIFIRLIICIVYTALLAMEVIGGQEQNSTLSS